MPWLPSPTNAFSCLILGFPSLSDGHTKTKKRLISVGTNVCAEWGCFSIALTVSGRVTGTCWEIDTLSLASARLFTTSAAYRVEFARPKGPNEITWPYGAKALGVSISGMTSIVWLLSAQKVFHPAVVITAACHLRHQVRFGIVFDVTMWHTVPECFKRIVNALDSGHDRLVSL